MSVDELIAQLKKLPRNIQVKMNIAAHPDLVFAITSCSTEDIEYFDGKKRLTLILKNNTPGYLYNDEEVKNAL